MDSPASDLLSEGEPMFQLEPEDRDIAGRMVDDSAVELHSSHR